jgi:hypothetical protein
MHICDFVLDLDGKISCSICFVTNDEMACYIDIEESIEES